MCDRRLEEVDRCSGGAIRWGVSLDQRIGEVVSRCHDIGYRVIEVVRRCVEAILMWRRSRQPGRCESWGIRLVGTIE